MKNYQDNDYALNKYSDGIVYRFADSTVTVTLADYLAENPDKSLSDFNTLKKISDSIYYDQDYSECAQNRRNLSIERLSETSLCNAMSPEEIFFAAIDEQEKAEYRNERLKKAKFALKTLTKAQRHRFLLQAVTGLTTREIAEMEGVKHQSVVECLAGAKKKIKKYCANE